MIPQTIRQWPMRLPSSCIYGFFTSTNEFIWNRAAVLERPGTALDDSPSAALPEYVARDKRGLRQLSSLSRIGPKKKKACISASLRILGVETGGIEPPTY